jgi:hypothetical protein
VTVRGIREIRLKPQQIRLKPDPTYHNARLKTEATAEGMSEGGTSVQPHHRFDATIPACPFVA